MDSYRPTTFLPRNQEPPRFNLVPWIVGALVAGLAWWFRDLLMLLGVAFGLAWALSPAVDWLASRRVPRIVAIGVVLLGVGVVTTVLVWLAIPDIIGNVSQLATALPQRVQQDWLPRLTRALLWLRRHAHVRIPLTADAWISSLASRASSVAQGSLSVVLSAANVSLSIVEFAVEVLIVVALSFYMLAGWHRVVDTADGLVPLRVREDVRRIAGRVDRVLGRYVRGQFLVMLILGTLFATGLGALHVPAGTGLGIFAGLIAFVPYLGFFIALGIAALLAALDPTGQCSVVAVVVYMVVVHLLDITVITPRVLGGSIGLSPVFVIIALLAGAQSFGFLGLLIAVPVAAVVGVLLDELIDWYKSTHFYGTPPAHTLVTDESLGGVPTPAPRLTQPPPELP